MRKQLKRWRFQSNSIQDSVINIFQMKQTLKSRAKLTYNAAIQETTISAASIADVNCKHFGANWRTAHNSLCKYKVTHKYRNWERKRIGKENELLAIHEFVYILQRRADALVKISQGNQPSVV